MERRENPYNFESLTEKRVYDVLLIFNYSLVVIVYYYISIYYFTLKYILAYIE